MFTAIVRKAAVVIMIRETRGDRTNHGFKNNMDAHAGQVRGKEGSVTLCFCLLIFKHYVC